jgi:NitT/TauT family transport system ATP-binding protein
MSTYSAFKTVGVPQSVEEGAAFAGHPLTFPTSLLANGTGLFASLAWIGFGLSCLWWEDLGDWPRTHAVAIAAFVVAGVIFAATASGTRLGRFAAGLQARTPWLLALGLFLTLWELATAKFAWLPLPFFPPPQAIVEVYTDDLPKLLDSVFASVKLQLGGYAIGAAAGFLTGVSIGWSRSVGYWVHPVLRLIGPLPATAWLPFAFFTFPSSWSASTFLIALATGFPVTIVPGVESGHSRRAAARLCRAFHGPRIVVRRAGRRRNDRRQGGPRLVFAVGPGLGSLFEHVCRADRDVAVMFWRHHPAVQDARPAAGLAEGRRQMVALAIAESASPASAGASLDVEGVSHGFDIDGAVLPVLDNVSFSVKPGEFVALLGPSGCGKSTLLRLVAGLEPPRSGNLRENGEPITGPFPSRVVVFQDPTLFPWRTVWDNIALGLEAQGILKRQRHRVDAAIDLVGLSTFRNVYPHQLSGGMAQRVALARALVNDPKIFILDEPLGKLDSLTRITMQAEIASLWQRSGFTTLLVTHDIEEAVFLANRVIVFSDRPARIKADIAVDRPYPRHRGDAKLAELRRNILGLLGLDETW